jgi:hypothetical protein
MPGRRIAGDSQLPLQLAKVHVETGEVTGVRWGNPTEETRPITLSGKWKGWRRDDGSGCSTEDAGASKTPAEGRARTDRYFVEQREARVR